jgi:hypothetical protein
LYPPFDGLGEGDHHCSQEPSEVARGATCVFPTLAIVLTAFARKQGDGAFCERALFGKSLGQQTADDLGGGLCIFVRLGEGNDTPVRGFQNASNLVVGENAGIDEEAIRAADALCL